MRARTSCSATVQRGGILAERDERRHGVEMRVDEHAELPLAAIGEHVPPHVGVCSAAQHAVEKNTKKSLQFGILFKPRLERTKSKNLFLKNMKMGAFQGIYPQNFTDVGP